MGLQNIFPRKVSIIMDDSSKNNLIKMNSTPMMNIDGQQLNNNICENINGRMINKTVLHLKKI